MKQTTLIAVTVGLSVVAVFGALFAYSMIENTAVDYVYDVYLEKTERFSQIENEIKMEMINYPYENHELVSECIGATGIWKTGDVKWRGTDSFGNSIYADETGLETVVWQYTKDQWNCITDYGDFPELQSKIIELNNEYKQLAKEIGDMENEVIRTPFENGFFSGKI